MRKNFKTIISSVLALSLIVTNTAMVNANAYDEVAEGEKLADQVGVQIDCDESARELVDLSQINDGEMPDIILDEDNDIKMIDGVVSDDTVKSADDARDVIANVSNLLGIDNVDNEIRFNRSDSGLYNDTYDFIQYYDGVEIENAHIKVVVDKETKEAQFLNNSYKSDISIDTTPAISIDKAKEIVFDTYNAEASEDTKLVIFEDPQTSEYKLAWHVSTNNITVPDVYVNAADGSILCAQENTENDYTPTTYTSWWNTLILNYNNPILNSNSFTVDLEKDPVNNKYNFHDTKRDIWMANLHRTGYFEPRPGFSVSTTNPNAQEYHANLAVLYNVEKTYDFYSDLNWDSYDGNGSDMYIIAEWMEDNQPVANACSNGSTLYFGAGGMMDNLETQNWGTDLDVVAHEYTHSVTQNKVGFFLYGSESRVLSEAYSDIMGELVDETPEWQQGTDQILSNTNKNNSNRKQYCVRDIAASTMKYNDSVYNNNSTDFHDQSMVVSHAAYLMDQFGIDREDNARIWFTSLDYLTSNATLADCRTAVENAALQVFRYRGYGARMDCLYSVKTAFNAVGIMDPTEVMGDLNNNGRVDSADYNFLRNCLNGTQGFAAPGQRYLADVNFDNRIDSNDLVKLQSMIG
ncbi:MAG: M4 family metallopeptidase [Oscillospiraceae bacterium]|nr:M4 family metallopeptidase [Oscillospiraceae bacterium]